MNAATFNAYLEELDTLKDLVETGDISDINEVLQVLNNYYFELSVNTDAVKVLV